MSGRQASLHQTHPVIPHVVCVLEVRHMHACVCMRVHACAHSWGSATSSGENGAFHSTK